VLAVKKFLAKEKDDFISKWEEPPKVLSLLGNTHTHDRQ